MPDPWNEEQGIVDYIERDTTSHEERLLNEQDMWDEIESNWEE
jgi:hypothetical protein